MSPQKQTKSKERRYGVPTREEASYAESSHSHSTHHIFHVYGYAYCSPIVGWIYSQLQSNGDFVALIDQSYFDTTVAVRLLPAGQGYICAHLHHHDIDDVCAGADDHDDPCDCAACLIAAGLATDVTAFHITHSGQLIG